LPPAESLRKRPIIAEPLQSKRAIHSQYVGKSRFVGVSDYAIAGAARANSSRCADHAIQIEPIPKSGIGRPRPDRMTAFRIIASSRRSASEIWLGSLLGQPGSATTATCRLRELRFVAVRTKRPVTPMVPGASGGVASLCVLYIRSRKIFTVFTHSPL